MMISGKVSVFDFIVFGVSLVVPVAIALYYSCVQRQKTTNAVFLADRSLSALPISFSLAVSYLSALTITGIVNSFLLSLYLGLDRSFNGIVSDDLLTVSSKIQGFGETVFKLK